MSHSLSTRRKILIQYFGIRTIKDKMHENVFEVFLNFPGSSWLLVVSVNRAGQTPGRGGSSSRHPAPGQLA